MKHVIVVGSGIAGLIAAMEIARRHDVTLVTKARLSESNTRYAQGGIAAAMTRDDSAAEHTEDTIRAGAGLCDAKAVEVLCVEGPRRIRDLIRLGVAFDMHKGELARGLEAAHTRARVLHAGGDATGLQIEVTLVRALQAVPSIRLLEHTFASDVVQSAGRVTGLQVRHADGMQETITADAVVLASGGAGQLFEHTSNPAIATGDGLAMALRAGAAVADLEFYQFHPTLLALPGAPFLISEAVRGEGAVLLDAAGNRFMQIVHAGAELAPRDVVARAIAKQMSQQHGAPVFLDATHLGADFLRARFPTIDQACRDHGVDWSARPIPVTPGAHYWMGGVRTDLFGRTSLRGLYAVGEVACTGVHGANRLASNSLLESLVFAWRCAHLLLSESPMVEAGYDWPSSGAAATILTPDMKKGTELLEDRGALQRLMWQHVGIRRTAEGLRHAAVQLSRWRTAPHDAASMETENLLTLAQAVCAAAQARQESRGAHWRDDFPAVDASFSVSNVFVQACQAKPQEVLHCC